MNLHLILQLSKIIFLNFFNILPLIIINNSYHIVILNFSRKNEKHSSKVSASKSICLNSNNFLYAYYIASYLECDPLLPAKLLLVLTAS